MRTVEEGGRSKPHDFMFDIDLTVVSMDPEIALLSAYITFTFISVIENHF